MSQVENSVPFDIQTLISVIQTGNFGRMERALNVCDASFFVFHAIERKISLSNNATLSQSELIQMFFIRYDKHERCFCS